ncbi:MAG: hypothetical protein GXY88_04330 [Tissierellia bacterium]|nr:hypothetical protein [Tissierellia bacterium]
MKSIFNIMEKVLIGVAIICITFLLLIQFMAYVNNYSILTSRFNWPSRYTSYSHSLYYGKGVVILKNMMPEYKDVNVLVNGEYFTDFTKGEEVEITVYDNDLIEIDGTKYNEKLHFKIIGISSNVVSPKLDSLVTVSQSIEIVGKVQLK